jgi:cobalt/nickel transport system ATP-binding protein
MSIILEARDVHYTYPGGFKALQGLSFHIRKGEKIALIGPNGAGKSTLLQMCNGLLQPDEGVMLFDNKPIRYDTRSLRDVRRRVGFVLQNSDRQIIAPTVYQDVAFGPANLGYDKETIRTQVTHALHQVGLFGFDRRPPYQLSGGEKKRVAIAGILAMDPDVLVFDEPTSGLDPEGSDSVMELLDELHHDGKTILISTHDVELAYPWADRIILLRDGSILREDVPDVALGDIACVRLAHLCVPILLDLSKELEIRGFPQPKRRPKTVLDMIQIIEDLIQDSTKDLVPSFGVVWVYNVDTEEQNGNSGNEEAFFLNLQESKTSLIGAMGTRAKQYAHEKNVVLDFSYGVIDKCILVALRGKNTLIITSGNMVARTIERVMAYGIESGNSIAVREVQKLSDINGSIVNHEN